MKSLNELFHENEFIDVDIKGIEINPEVEKKWKKEQIVQIQEGHADADGKRNLLVFVAYKK